MKIEPKLDESVNMLGGSMYVSRVIDQNTVEATHFWARWLKVVCRVVRHKNRLYAV